MKFADTPSRSAGLIISVFGVASSPMVPSRTAHGRGRERTGERRFGQGSSGVGPLLLLGRLVHLLRFRAALRLRALRGGCLFAGLWLGLRRLGNRGRLELGEVRARDDLARPLHVLS